MSACAPIPLPRQFDRDCRHTAHVSDDCGDCGVSDVIGDSVVARTLAAIVRTQAVGMVGERRSRSCAGAGTAVMSLSRGTMSAGAGVMDERPARQARYCWSMSMVVERAAAEMSLGSVVGSRNQKEDLGRIRPL